MIADVQYNDLRGTAAADVSDFYMNSLQHYLEVTYKSYDSERYYCTGCTIWAGDSGNRVNVTFVCYDKQTDKHVIFEPLKEYSFEETFSLFKRFNVIIGTDINEVQVSEEDRLQLADEDNQE